jgi:hypothetical protein
MKKESSMAVKELKSRMLRLLREVRSLDTPSQAY